MKRHNLRLPVLGFALAAFLSACSGSSSDDEGGFELVFTAIPDHNSTELEQKFQPVAAYLAEKLGVQVRYLGTADYGASVEAFKNGEVHLAWFGGLTGVQARASVPGARAIAFGRIDPEFRSYFVANAATGLTPSEDFPMELAGKSFTFGSERSTSGRLMPEAFIRQFSGKAPADFFGSPNHFSGSHDQTAKLVEAGTYQAGALNYKTYDTMVAEGKLDPAVCVKIWTSPPYADYNWTAHPDLEVLFGEGFIDRLQQALVEMDDPELLRAVDRSEGLIPATNEDFDALAVVARELGFLD